MDLKDIKTTEDVWAAIEEHAGVDRSAAPRGSQFLWFELGEGGPTRFAMGAVCPLKRNHVIFALFQDRNEVRIYTLPGEEKKDAPKKKDPTAAFPHRFTLTKTAPTFFVEAMTLEQLRDECSDEFVLLAGVDDNEERIVELEACLARTYGAMKAVRDSQQLKTSAATLVDRALEDISDTLNDEDEEDEDEGTNEEKAESESITAPKVPAESAPNGGWLDGEDKPSGEKVVEAEDQG